MLFSAPLEVARTNAWTFAPSATSASVRCEPMKPSAPVTRTVRPPVGLADLVVELGDGLVGPDGVARHPGRVHSP